MCYRGEDTRGSGPGQTGNQRDGLWPVSHSKGRHLDTYTHSMSRTRYYFVLVFVCGLACITLIITFKARHWWLWVSRTTSMLAILCNTGRIYGFDESKLKTALIYEMTECVLFWWLTYPPMEMPVIPRGQYPSLSSQRRSTVDSRIKAPPITNRSDTFFRLDRLKYSQIISLFTLHWINPSFKRQSISVFDHHPL